MQQEQNKPKPTVNAYAPSLDYGLQHSSDQLGMQSLNCKYLVI